MQPNTKTVCKISFLGPEPTSIELCSLKEGNLYSLYYQRKVYYTDTRDEYIKKLVEFIGLMIYSDEYYYSFRPHPKESVGNPVICLASNEHTIEKWFCRKVT